MSIGVASSDSWFSWKRVPDELYLDKWVKPHQEARDRYLTVITSLANFTWRDNDVMITSFSRSGTHLLWYMTRLIVQKSCKLISDPMEQSHIGLNLFMPENQDDSPIRVLNGHQIPSVLSSNVILKDNRKFIYIMRNPKDVLTSLCMILPDFSNYVKWIPSFDELVDDWCRNEAQVLGVSWFHHVRAWEHFLQDYPHASVLPLYYEDVVLDPHTAIRQIAHFLEIDLAECLVNDIAETTRFEKMSIIASSLAPLTGFGLKGPPHFYRKGKVGDWKNWFTVEQSRRFDRCVSKYLEGSDLKFRYSSASK